MVNSFEEIVDLHHSSGNIEDAYFKIHIDDKILKLNTFTMNIMPNSSWKEDVKLWQAKIDEEIQKDKKLEKEIKEFRSVFQLLNQYKIRTGIITKSESPDFVLERKRKTIGIEITKIYVGYDWMLEKISNEIRAYRINKEDVGGYIEYKKAEDKVEFRENGGEIVISPKLFPMMNLEYSVMIKNKIFEKIRKLFDDYQKYDENIIYAEITSPEYFEDISDLDALSKEIFYYIRHLEEVLDEREYHLVIRINSKWINLNLKDGNYQIL